MKMFFILLVLYFIPSNLFASSEQAYRDYQYQYDFYRQKYNEYKIAKDAYDKYKTLTSKTEALEKSKTMLSSRDIFLRSYLMVLSEKLIENPGLSDADKELYRTLIANEVTFLNSHSELIPAVASLSDAKSVSNKLQSHYTILQASVRQIIIGLSLGDLSVSAKSYDQLNNAIKTFIIQTAGTYPSEKTDIINRWMLSIDNKMQLYLQQIQSINQGISQIKAASIVTLDSKTAEIQKSLDSARTYLREGSGYMNEVLTLLKYYD